MEEAAGLAARAVRALMRAASVATSVKSLERSLGKLAAREPAVVLEFWVAQAGASVAL